MKIATTNTSANVVVKNDSRVRNLKNQGDKKKHQKAITIWWQKILVTDLRFADVRNGKLLLDCRIPGTNGNVLAEGVETLLENYLQLCRDVQEFKAIMKAWKEEHNTVLNERLVRELWKDAKARSLAKRIYALSNKKDFRFVQTEELVGAIVQTARTIAENVRAHWRQTAETINNEAGKILDEVERALEGKTGYQETPSTLSAQVKRVRNLSERYGHYLSEALKERASKASEKIGQYQEVWQRAKQAEEVRRAAEEQAWRAKEKARRESEEAWGCRDGINSLLEHVEAQIASGVRYQKSTELQKAVMTAIKLAGSRPSEKFSERIVAIATSTPGKRFASLAEKEELASAVVS